VSTPRVTIREVAVKAGVSVTTVSHALNGKGKVKGETIALVRQVADELGYRPSPTAQALRSGRTGSIALILPMERPELAHRVATMDYYMQLAASAASVAFAHARPLILPPNLGTTDEWRSINPDGVLLCDPVDNDPRLDVLAKLRIPVVTIERDYGRPDWVNWVGSDNLANTHQVLNHLRDAGARRIALLSTDWNRAWSREIDDAYATWCAMVGHPPLVGQVSVSFDPEAAYIAARDLLDRPDAPDAFYAPADGYSEGVMRAAAEKGLRIPHDLLLVSGSDENAARYSSPSVTAVDLSPSAEAEAAVNMLLKLIDGGVNTCPVVVASTLRVRQSTTR
jgi:DNA-binding LacI/PurR family transcriptional regulator